MFKILKEDLIWGERKLTLETGKIARQSDGAVVATYGGTSVLCTTVFSKQPKKDASFLPLTVNYVERLSAAGRIPGGFFRREGRPSEREILLSRLIDRPIRPLFPRSFFNETGIICTLLSYDSEIDPDIVAMIGASASLEISGIPLIKPVAAVKIGYKDGHFLLNPTCKQIESSDLDLVMAGTMDDILMVELGSNHLPDQIVLDALDFGLESIKDVLYSISRLKEQAYEAGFLEKSAVIIKLESDNQVTQIIKEAAIKDLQKAYSLVRKKDRTQAIKNVYLETISTLQSRQDLDLEESQISTEIQSIEEELFRKKITEDGIRLDGRKVNEIRPIECEVGWLRRVHGSALFTRGETQTIVTTTLGTPHDEQIIDSLNGESRENFLLHYNFPSYAVGEVSRQIYLTRREIGHGKLAWRAIRPVLPDHGDFPYTIRVVSDITESNGSSSMATVCGASLSLMDAGVQIKQQSAGIAMGLISCNKKDNEFIILSDILGDEDSLGDMDLKVAGTRNGITALQLDVKVTGIKNTLIRKILNQAWEGLHHILDCMQKSISKPRKNLSSYAPQIRTISISKEKVRQVIGPGGKVIRDICEQTKTRISIDDGGIASITGLDKISIDLAIEKIQSIGSEAKIGSVYSGTIQKVIEFGVIVCFLGNKTGLLHISQIPSENSDKIEDMFRIGDKIFVKLIGINDQGKFRLSSKGIDQKRGESMSNIQTDEIVQGKISKKTKFLTNN